MGKLNFNRRTFVQNSLVLTLCVASAACQSMGQRRPTSIQAAPTGPVVVAQLPQQIQTSDVQSNLETPTTDFESEAELQASSQQDMELQASLSSPAPTASVGPVTKNGLIGVWRLNTNSDSCRLSLALTQWTGGFRANTLQCSSGDVVNIKSWNVEGNELIVKDKAGVPIAALRKVGNTRYAGTLPGNRRVVLSR